MAQFEMLANENVWMPEEYSTQLVMSLKEVSTGDSGGHDAEILQHSHPN